MALLLKGIKDGHNMESEALGHYSEWDNVVTPINSRCSRQKTRLKNSRGKEWSKISLCMNMGDKRHSA